MSARTWRGVPAASRADGCFDCLQQTGLKTSRFTEGNSGLLVFRRFPDDHAGLLLVSPWTSLNAVRKVAGSEVEKAVSALANWASPVELEPNATHADVLAGPGTP